MVAARTFVLTLASALFLMVSLASAPAEARGHCSQLRLSCENGRNYPVCPIAISPAGDLVTARIITGRGRGVYVRLIPMGNGYRYAGLGTWLDGIEGDAVLYRGKSQAIACTVSHG
jgi:hypothetical protein